MGGTLLETGTHPPTHPSTTPRTSPTHPHLQIAEGRRLLRPGGLLAFVDINPNSTAGKTMPPAVATLMKATEPWTDEYYFYPLEEAMGQV